MSVRIPRRCSAILILLMLAALLPAFAQGTQAVNRIVVPLPAGGPMDVLARLMAPVLAKNLNETVIVENRPGASAMIGAEAVVKSPPDGHTMLLATSFLATNPVLYKVRFDAQRDLLPVIELNQVDMVLVVRRDLPAQGPGDLKRLAAMQRGGLNCAAPPGEMALACEKLRHVLAGDVVPVPFAGFSQALNALIGGHVDLMFAPRDVVEAQLAGQRIVPLACAGAVAPQGPLSHLPLLKDTWPGFAVEGWVGVLVPSGTPPEKVSQLNREFNRVLEDPQVHHMLASWGPPPLHNAPEKLARSLAEKTEYYRRLAAEIGLSPP